MKVDANHNYGVLTGDIVASTSLRSSDRKRLYDVMQDGGEELRTFMGERMPLPLDIYSGDSWQILLSEPRSLLRAGLFYRAFIRAHMPVDLTRLDLPKGGNSQTPLADTRVALAIGRIDFVPKQRISEAEGPALQASGRLLKELTGKVRMRLVWDGASQAQTWDLLLQAMDALIVQTWSPRRCQCVLGALRGMKQREIADRQEVPVKQQTVQRLLDRAGWEWVEKVLDRFENSQKWL